MGKNSRVEGIMLGLPEEVQPPAHGVTDHVGHQTAVESGVAAFVAHDIAHEVEGVPPLWAVGMVH